MKETRLKLGCHGYRIFLADVRSETQDHVVYVEILHNNAVLPCNASSPSDVINFKNDCPVCNGRLKGYIFERTYPNFFPRHPAQGNVDLADVHTVLKDPKSNSRLIAVTSSYKRVRKCLKEREKNPVVNLGNPVYVPPNGIVKLRNRGPFQLFKN